MTTGNPMQELAQMLYHWCSLDVTPENLRKLLELKQQCEIKALNTPIKSFALFQLLEPHNMDMAVAEKLFHFLIAQGIDYRYKGARGNLLHICILRNRQNVFDFLLEKQLSVNEINSHGKTPLHLAISNNQPYYVKRLLAIDNIDTTLKDKQGKTAFDYVNEQTLPEIKQLIRQHVWTKQQQQCFSEKHQRYIREAESSAAVSKLSAFFTKTVRLTASQPRLVDRSQYHPITSPGENKPTT